MIGRAMLGNPRWPIQAAADLGDEIPWPNQYARGFTKRVDRIRQRVIFPYLP